MEVRLFRIQIEYLRAFALAISTMAIFPEPTVAQNDNQVQHLNPERAAESRYHRLIAQDPAQASEWYMIGEWCFAVAAELPERSRRVFEGRARKCFDRAENMALTRLRSILDTATRGIEAVTLHAEGVAIRREARDEAQKYLDGMLPVLKDNRAMSRQLSQVFEEGLEEMEDALRPLLRHESIARIRSGLVPMKGEWVPLAGESEGYDGFFTAEELTRSAEAHVGRALSTAIRSSLTIHELVGKQLLDGFDEKNRYLVPNFKEDRFVLVLDPQKSDWYERIHDFRKRQKKSEREQYALRLLVDLRQESVQFTKYYEGTVRQITVLDDAGGILEHIGIEEDLYASE